MIRRRVAGLAPAALAASLLLAACGTPSGSGAAGVATSSTTTTTISSTRLSLAAQGPLPTCLEPGIPSTEAGNVLAQMLLPSPFYVAADGSVDPNLQLLADGRAEVVNTDPFTVVYEINPKARWSNGERVKAGDFTTAWRVRAISNQPAYSPYRLIKSVRASKGGEMVTATFTEHYADWRSLFSQLIPKSLEPVPGLETCLPVDRQLPSAGPWRISEVGEASVQLTASPSWWGEPAPFSGVQLSIAASQAQLAMWAGLGSVDVVAGSNPDLKAIVAASMQRDYQRQVGLTSQLVDLEMRTEGGPTKDELVRRALVALLNRQDLVTATSSASSLQYTPAASHVFAPNVSSYPSGAYPSPTASRAEADSGRPPGLAAPNAQPDLAAKLLAKAGYRRGPLAWTNEAGRPLALNLAVPSVEPLASLGAMLAEQWTDAGIAVSIQPTDGVTAAGEQLAQGQVDAAVLLRRISAFPTQVGAWYSPATGDAGALDYSGFADPEVDALLAKASQELNPVYAIEDYRAVDELLWTHAPTLPLLWLPQLWAARADLLGPESSVLGFDAASIVNWRRTTDVVQQSARGAR